LQYLGGSLAGTRIYEQFQTKIGMNAINEKLKAMDELLVDVDGVEYIVVPPDGGAGPRHLSPYKKETEDTPLPPPVRA
jgi:hypothetical protein